MDGCSLWCVFVHLSKYNQSGASSPYLYYRESKPYAKDKVGMKAPLSFYALFMFYILTLRRAIGVIINIMGPELRELMELWLRLSGGAFNPCDEQRFYDFVFEAVRRGVAVEQEEYAEIIEMYKAHNANLNDEYLNRYDFNHFESFYEFGKYILEKLNF